MVNYPTNYDDDKTLYVVTDLAKTQLSADIDEAQTTIPVVDTSKFPDYGIIRIGDELIKYTSKTATSFEGCIRGYGGTTAVGHSANTLVWLPILGEHHNTLKDAIIQIEKLVGLKPEEWDVDDNVVRKLQSLQTEVSNIDLTPYDNHLINYNNPHHTTLEQVRNEDNTINGPIDFNNNEALNLVLEKISSFSEGFEGRIVYYSGDKHIYIYDGSSWIKILVESDLQPINQQINDLQTQVNNNKSDISTLQSQLSTTQTELSNLEAQFNTHTTSTNPHNVTLEQVRSENNIIKGDIDFNHNRAINFAFENKTVSDKTDPVKGEVVYDGSLFIYDGVKWKKIIDEDSQAQTLSNIKLKDLQDVPEYVDGRFLKIVDGQPTWSSISTTDTSFVVATPNDTAPGTLNEKIVVDGSILQKTVLNPGANEQLELKVNVDDTTISTTNLWTAAKIQSELDKKMDIATYDNDSDGVVEEADHAVNADNATHATNADNANNSDKVDGYDVDDSQTTGVLWTADRIKQEIQNNLQTQNEFIELTDTPSSYVADHVVVVNSTANGLEFENTFILDGGVY